MKVHLSNITSGANTSAINDNFAQIGDALNNKALYRDNPIGEPNQMINLLDMNGNKIINVVVIIPSSPSGLPSGALYSDGSGFAKVVP